MKAKFSNDIFQGKIVLDHFNKFCSAEKWVMHEIVSDTIHLDIYGSSPTDDSPYYTLLTSGVSSVPMNTSGLSPFNYVEFLIHLPASWKINETDLKKYKWFWPFDILIDLARYIHKNDAWVNFGHTIDLGKKQLAYDAILLELPMGIDSNLFTFKNNNNEDVLILSVIPIYKKEVNAIQNFGSDKFIDWLVKNEYFDFFVQKRKSYKSLGSL